MNEHEQMLTSILNCKRADLFLDPVNLDSEQQSVLDEMINRRKKGEPLQYIIGDCQFMGLKFFVDKDVLIPRPETELLVEYIIEMSKQVENEKISILDLGTGSGNIAISLAKLIDYAEVTSVDISSDALEVAKKNADAHDVNSKVDFVNEDIVTFLINQSIEGFKYDIIVSNPPYIKTSDLSKLPEDVQYEPKVALDGGFDGLNYYRNIIEVAKSLLKRDGYLFFEIGDGQRQPIESMFSNYEQYRNLKFKRDYVGTFRLVSAQKK